MMENVTLNNGTVIPFVGLGTSNLGSSENEFLDILNMALDIGYRLFDTANGYNNENVIGRFVSRLPVPRSEILITSKLNDNLHSYSAAVGAVSETLERLRTDYLDLFLVHNPNSQIMRECMREKFEVDSEYWMEANVETWRALEDCVAQGKIRCIGVSNFEIRHLKALIPHVKIIPAVNQIKYCVGCYKTQESLIEFCKSNAIQIQGYSPLGKGNATKTQQIKDIAANNGCMPEDVILSYLTAKSIPTIVRASSREHLISNIRSQRITLSDDDLRKIEECNVNENWAKIKNPDTGEKYN